jgi:AcrR family transcriptional regulator
MIPQPKPKKDKELTKKKLIDSVGKILQAEEFDNVGVNQIAKLAHVHKKLIYRYFGKVDYLLEAYIAKKDFWLKLDGDDSDDHLNKKTNLTPNHLSALIKNNFETLYNEEELQHLSLWQLNTDTPLMRSIARITEEVIVKYSKAVAEGSKDNDMKSQAMIAILLGGIHYCVIKSKKHGNAFMGINLDDSAAREEFKRAIDQIVATAYSAE